MSTTYDLYTCVVPFLDIPIYHYHMRSTCFFFFWLLLFVLVMPNTIVYYGIQIHNEYFSTNRVLGALSCACMSITGCAGTVVFCGVEVRV